MNRQRDDSTIVAYLFVRDGERCDEQRDFALLRLRDSDDDDVIVKRKLSTEREQLRRRMHQVVHRARGELRAIKYSHKNALPVGSRTSPVSN